MKLKNLMLEFGIGLVWFLVLFNCTSVVFASHWGFFNQAKTLAGSVLSTLNGSKSTVEANQSIGKIFVFEDSLIKKYSEMVSNYKKELELESETSYSSSKRPLVKFPEASAFSTTFFQNISVNFETWMDSKECDLPHAHHEIVSQHILLVRNCENEICTSFFIYRPSFLAELDPEAQAQHVHYHTEAVKTFDKVHNVLSKNPYDQIIFAGLQSGGAIALLHSWMAVASNPHLCKNLVEYKGNLHQIKVFLYDTDCVISTTNQKNFPIPQWDILRFYSNIPANISSKSCRIPAMSPIGLPYIYNNNIFDIFGFSAPSVNRAQFTKYFLSNQAQRMPSLYETEDSYTRDALDLDLGVVQPMSSNFDDEGSLAPSEISMSVNEDSSPIQTQIDNPAPAPFLQFLGRKDSNEESIYSEKYEKIGIKCLQESLRISKFFHSSIKNIYRSQQEAHLRRDVFECAAAMSRYLSDVLLGNGAKIVATSLKKVKCDVDTYNVRSKEALIICSLSDTKNPIPIPIFRFKAHVLNETERLLKTLNVTVIENGWEEVSFMDQMPNYISDASALRPRGDSSITMTTNYEILDERSVVSKTSSPTEQWKNCLGALFASSKHLNFINPLKEHFSTASVIGGGADSQEPGKVSITINLPYTHSEATCEFSLLNKSADFYKFYRNSPSMFYSVFSDTINSSPCPAHCKGLLQPLFIENSGNAMTHSNALKSFFVSHQISTDKIDERDTIVGGYEIQSGVTNLPSANPYSVFTPDMCDKVSLCLNTIERSKIMYDCTSKLTLWIGEQYCPDICINAPDSSKLHLCSRVINCGGGVFFGFRGCSLPTPFKSESSIESEFSTVKSLGLFQPHAYYSAFQIKNADKSVTNFSRPIRFAIFLNSSAVRSEISSTNIGLNSSANNNVYTSNPSMFEQRSIRQSQFRPNSNADNSSQMDNCRHGSISSASNEDKEAYGNNEDTFEQEYSFENIYSHGTNDEFTEDPKFILDKNLKDYNIVIVSNQNIQTGVDSDLSNTIANSAQPEKVLEADDFENISSSDFNRADVEMKASTEIEAISIQTSSEPPTAVSEHEIFHGKENEATESPFVAVNESFVSLTTPPDEEDEEEEQAGNPGTEVTADKKKKKNKNKKKK